MEAVGAGASILTFITVAFSVTQSIHSALSAIKDGPQVIRLLTDEIFQLKSILQRLDEVSFVSINDIDKSQLNGLAKKCKDDLSALNFRLKSLDVANSDGRGDRLWRKLKLSFSGKDLDQVRHVVRGHVQHLTVRLNLIQVQQGSFTATQSTQILDLLQQLKQDISALQTTNTATLIAEEDSSSTSARVTEVDDEEMDCSPDTSLDDSINRLMRLLEKKPCVVESDDSEELLKDIEHLLECIRNDAEPVESEGACQNCSQDVSKELKLMTNIILSSPSMMINQTEATRFWRPAGEQLLISQKPKRKAFETDDGVITVTTAKRRRKASSESETENAKNEAKGDFLAKLTYMSKRTKKMLSLSVNQRQLLFSSFSSMLPSIVVCNIKPKDSPVFDIARNGSVQDLLKLIEGGEAHIHDHDAYGWSLLHHSVGNLPVLKFLIKQGLDVDEVADQSDCDSQITPSHLSLNHGREHYEALLHAGADITLSVRKRVDVMRFLTDGDTEDGCIRMEQTIYISPFARDTSIHSEYHDLIPTAHRQIQFLTKQGYDINGTVHGRTSLHWLMIKECDWIEYMPEYMDLLMFVLENGGDPYATDDNGYLASHYAYNATCEADYLFCHSARGDLWDAALTYFGYDILETRRHYPRKARYTHGYTRGDFEKLWHGREGDCPYWDDQPWPASGQTDTVEHLCPPIRGQLCESCLCCVETLDCVDCGVCLSSFEFFCEDDDHKHSQFCPREQVAAWELREEEEEVYWELVHFSDSKSGDNVLSSEDSEDGGILLQDRLEEAFSDASREES
ncbi:uncharacterized protein FSUBG_3712 [Fusarium subglutinans]|uniref:Azaphilone pigments biosynthesis cluster protein L N-terminal domain-containing protein n=1 Tax=Gibberella subglutinans TaxID=42677 RepID=A0A8H5V457_GIBSU|nr:uncharacterized protein FSUBG_3712 [Fusarium subglutinans]KAF5609931.1 hypothetical protein FSUBG_3712 [Fusarium subglutinans]